MKYIPLIENLEELLSLGYFEEKDTDINNLTPMEALNKLNEIKKFAGIN